MDETLKTRVIAALRESARVARNAEQGDEAMALVEALMAEDAPAVEAAPVEAPVPAEAVAEAPHDEVRQAAQAEVAQAETDVYTKVNAPTEGGGQ